MIRVTCPECHHEMTVADELADAQVSCPGCQTIIVVPSPRRLATPGPAPQTALSPPPRPDAIDLKFLRPPGEGGGLGRLGGFRILGVVGAGGMGVVLHAEDSSLNRPVALKVMRPEYAANTEARQRFLREGRSAAAVDHPHVVPVWQVGEDNGIPFLVMPLLRGESLGDRLDRPGRMSVAEVVRVAREAAEGLAAAHARGLIHRDIKPDNLFLEGPAARVRLLDFGLARAAEGPTRLTHSQKVLGTPQYMAPEQIRDPHSAGPRSDLFSLGCVLFEVATGRRAFSGRDAMSAIASVTLDEPPDAATLNPDVPPALADLVRRLLSKDPAGRPASADVVVAELRALEASPIVGGTPVWRWLVPVVAVLLAVVMTTFVVGLTDRSGTGGTVAPDTGPTDTGPAPATRPNREAVVVVAGHRGGVSGAVFSGDGRRLVTLGRGDGMARVWDAETGAERAAVPVPAGLAPGSLAVDADGSHFAAAGREDGEVRVWTVGAADPPRVLVAKGGPVRTVAFAPGDGRVAGLGAGLTVWDAAGVTVVVVGGTDPGGSAPLAFSPDGTRLLVGDFATLRVRDAADGRLLVEVPREHEGAVWSADGTRIAARLGGANEGTFAILDAATGREEGRFTGKGFAGRAAFTADGRLLLLDYRHAGRQAAVYDPAAGRALPLPDPGRPGGTFAAGAARLAVFDAGRDGIRVLDLSDWLAGRP